MDPVEPSTRSRFTPGWSLDDPRVAAGTAGWVGTTPGQDASLASVLLGDSNTLL